MWTVLGAAAALGAAAYAVDVPVRRELAARAARACARARGLPLINVGAGTDQTAMFGATLYGDVNVDIGGRCDVPHGTPGVVTYADAERLPHPGRAIREWLRVVGGDMRCVFVVTPAGWAPHAWLHPGHLWYFPDGAGCTRAPVCVPQRLAHGLPGAAPPLLLAKTR